MAEPCDALIEDDVEQSSNSDEESSTESESDETSSSEDAGDEPSSSTSDDSCNTNIWDDMDDNIETEEAVEASLQDDYKMALNLIIDGDKVGAISVMQKLLEHPLLQIFKVNVDTFDWDSAIQSADDSNSRVSAMAKLFSSLHFNISRLVDDPIRHLLTVLTVYPKDEFLWECVGKKSMEFCDWPMALYAFEHCSYHPNIVRQTLIALYNANLYEECLEKIFAVLQYNKGHVLARVLKNDIRKTNKYWDTICAQIFSEDPMLANNSEKEVTAGERQMVMDEISRIGKPTVSKHFSMKAVDLNIADCTSLSEVGVVLCDLYDRIESFSSLALHRINVTDMCVIDESEQAIFDIINDSLDCIEVVEESINKMPTKKLKRSDLALDWRRRSVRFCAEFNIAESNSEEEESKIAALLDESKALDSTIIPLLSINPLDLSIRKSQRTHRKRYISVDERALLRSCVNYLATSFVAETGDILDLLHIFLSWMANNCFKIVLTDRFRKVIIGCYQRWITSFGNPASIAGNPEIHILVAEIGLDSALIVCMRMLINQKLNNALRCRMHWLVGVQGTNLLSSELCRNHLWEVIDLLHSMNVNKKIEYWSLIEEHELISEDSARELVDMMDRVESLKNIQQLFEEHHYQRVVEIIVENFNWNAVNRDTLLYTAAMLIDSFTALNDAENAAIWISRVLDLTGGLAGTNQMIDRLKKLDWNCLTHQTASNIVHCIVPLLTTNDYQSDVELWMYLYHLACLMEGDHSVESLKSLYQNDCQLMTSAMNILVSAHDAIASKDKCPENNYSFPIQMLHELAKIRSNKEVASMIASGSCSEQMRSFTDEVHQCLFCLFGFPSRRRRQLEDHGGSHNYEPSSADIECILSLLLPEHMPPYDGAIAVDLIEVIQKKASSYIEPNDELKQKLNEMDRFITNAQIKTCWPRCKQTSVLSSSVFYQMALHSYRNHRVDEAVRFTKLFLITVPSDADRQYFFWDWTVMAFASATAFFTVDEAIMFEFFDCSVFAFRMALFFGPEDRYVIFNLGSALYQMSSRIRRYKQLLALDDIAYQMSTKRLDGLIEESRKHFEYCVACLPDGDVDKWRCHYFIAKIKEKCADPLAEIFYHHHEAGRQMEIGGVQYPIRINTKKQDHAEAIEIHYRSYACLVKFLLETEIVWSRSDLILMHSFAVCFRSHGVSRSKKTDEFLECFQVKAVLRDLVCRCSIANDDVRACIDDLVQSTALKKSILDLCEEAFNICVQRFPHFKSYYRLAQLALYNNKPHDAHELLFNRFLMRKKSNFNPDNIFESIVTMTCKDIDRGDALQYHIFRITVLAINISSILCDVEALTTILHTLCTLHFCENTDYLLRRDLVVLYRTALSQLNNCVRQRIERNDIDVKLPIALYDLYQYAERNNVLRLCERIKPIIEETVVHCEEYDNRIKPLEFCRTVATSRKRSVRKKFGSATQLFPKRPRLSDSPIYPQQ